MTASLRDDMRRVELACSRGVSVMVATLDRGELHAAAAALLEWSIELTYTHALANGGTSLSYAAWIDAVRRLAAKDVERVEAACSEIRREF